jgi:hypothetical protein
MSYYTVKNGYGEFIMDENNNPVRFTLEQAKEINEQINNTGKIEKWCPDGGKCHHQCEECNCFRVAHCSPFSDYNNGEWKEEDKQYGK